MPNLIIPNAHELYVPTDYKPSHKEGLARLFYNFRFLWQLKPGDIILLPELPNKDFLKYILSFMSCQLNNIHIVTWHSSLEENFGQAIFHEHVINQLKNIIHDPFHWRIKTCYFNQAILCLVDRLKIPVNFAWRKIARCDTVRMLNNKILFREMANQLNIPIPKGQPCKNVIDFTKTLISLLPLTGSVMIKKTQEAGGRGNIGLTQYKDIKLRGAISTIYLDKNCDISQLAQELWEMHANHFSSQLIVEVYYSHNYTLTATVWIPPNNGLPVFLHCAEICMEKIWVGIKMPTQALDLQAIDDFKLHAMKLSHVIQKTGYEGYLCCDAIKTDDDQLVLTEINVRRGAETNAHLCARHLFGKHYPSQIIIMTRQYIPIISFSILYALLKENNLLFDQTTQQGIIILTIEDRHNKQAECLIVAPDEKIAYDFQDRLLSLV